MIQTCARRDRLRQLARIERVLLHEVARRRIVRIETNRRALARLPAVLPGDRQYRRARLRLVLLECDAAVQEAARIVVVEAAAIGDVVVAEPVEGSFGA